mgnify:CR=1 FL=1
MFISIGFISGVINPELINEAMILTGIKTKRGVGYYLDETDA